MLFAKVMTNRLGDAGTLIAHESRDFIYAAFAFSGSNPLLHISMVSRSLGYSLDFLADFG
jgi:hypothetical protein